MNQILFSFGNKTSYEVDDFFISPSNEIAYNQISLYPNWGEGRLSKVCMIIGPDFSGKTHLANIFAKHARAKFIDEKSFENNFIIGQYGAYIIDNFEEKLKYEERIFHIFNDCLDQKKFLLLLSSQPKSELIFTTKDLASRIQATNSIEIGDPTLDLMEAMIYKNFADRQISISPEIVKFILTRLERSYLAVQQLIEKIDQKSLINRSKINLNLAKEVLQELEEFQQ